jgi:hypothetical protein
VVKAGMLKSLPVDQHDRVLEKTAHIFLKGSKTD